MIDGGGKWIKVGLVQSGSRLQVTTLQRHQFFNDSFRVTATCATSGATLRYTTNGSVPTSASPVFPTTGLTVTNDTTLMVRAFKNGMNESETVVSRLYTMNGLISGDGIEIVDSETDWFMQTEIYNSAPSAMRSKAIDHNGSTSMTFTISVQRMSS